VIVILRMGAPRADADRVLQVLKERGVQTAVFFGEERTVITLLGAVADAELLQSLETLPGVDRVAAMQDPYRLASREAQASGSVVRVGTAEVGGSGFAVIAGPCIVRGREDLLELAAAVKARGASILRGDAYRAGDSPFAVQGLGPRGLAVLEEARRATGLPIATEVQESGQVETVSTIVDLVEVGPDNMKTLALLRAVGASGKPVILKRGLSATIEEWLKAAEHVMRAGNPNVILCERGIRTFEADRQSVLDVSSVPVVKRLSHLPVIVDPSHGTGHGYLVQPMALAAAAVGADGLLVEVHSGGDGELADGPQSLSLAEFERLMGALHGILGAVGRTLARACPPDGGVSTA
jgi:3-deoxy-7-phosphoheptulonate synthase